MNDLIAAMEAALAKFSSRDVLQPVRTVLTVGPTKAYFGLMPEFMGRRLGPYLLRWAVDAAWSTQPDKVTVNTCTLDHPKALSLYQKVGFRPVRQEQKVVEDPRLSGLIPMPAGT